MRKPERLYEISGAGDEGREGREEKRGEERGDSIVELHAGLVLAGQRVACTKAVYVAVRFPGQHGW
jgi:hypothetical protein